MIRKEKGSSVVIGSYALNTTLLPRTRNVDAWPNDALMQVADTTAGRIMFKGR